ncbi:MAG: 6-phosphogluconolactonase [Candidatus Cyclobacteriaceae bacterium M3_2C_046]
MSDSEIKIFSNAEILAQSLARNFQHWMAQADNDKKLNLALSGGSTPQKIFKHLAENYHNLIDWTKLNLFWVDERCVPPDHADSNYGMTRKLLLEKVNIPPEQVFRMKGEAEPADEARRYEASISAHVPQQYNMPRFDWIWLGMGDDGHTASIFPDQLALFQAASFCEVAIHPVSKQKRITLTGKILNNAAKVSFLVTGNSKAEMIHTILNQPESREKFPAAHVNPSEGKLEWFLDQSAAANL